MWLFLKNKNMFIQRLTVMGILVREKCVHTFVCMSVLEVRTPDLILSSIINIKTKLRINGSFTCLHVFIIIKHRGLQLTGFVSYRTAKPLIWWLLGLPLENTSQTSEQFLYFKKTYSLFATCPKHNYCNPKAGQTGALPNHIFAKLSDFKT